LSEPDEQTEITQLGEKVTQLEARLEELDKKIDAISGYQKQLYEYLRNQHR